MQFYSTRDRRHIVSLREAVLAGMPADNGLYMPCSIPALPKPVLQNLECMDLPEIAIAVCQTLFEKDLALSVIEDIVRQAINFPAPLIELADALFTLELFHGPTLAFKDFGARFMSRLMAHFVADSDRQLNILVATSGDTGSAVANGFFQVAGINVIILYPSQKVSRIQELQIATLGQNVHALEVQGTFDDCQRMVKTALVDPSIQERLLVTSANSINISRLIPQTFYYFHAYGQLPKGKREAAAISVPSGNFGNLTAGLFARKMGLPIQRFIAATNINDVVPIYLKSTRYQPKPSMQTISNAMDVGDPSNFVRIQELYNQRWERITAVLDGYRFTDDETRQAIRDIYRQFHYIADPHGAVGYLGAKTFRNHYPDITASIFLETAHPAKFAPVIEPEIQAVIPVPRRLQKALEGSKISVLISNDYKDLKEWLHSHPKLR